jgi:hypothetical protein
MTFTIDKKFSEALSQPLIKAYQQGGLALTFLVLGAMFLFASAFLDRSNPLVWVLALTGLIVVLIVVALFYFQAIRPIKNAQNAVSTNADTLDAVQRAAMQMTEVAYLVQAVAFKHGETIRQLIGIATVKVRQVPIIGPQIGTALEGTLDKYNSSVVELTEDAKSVIDGVRDALARADAHRLNIYVGQLAQVRDKLALALKATTDASPVVSIPTDPKTSATGA